jgi:predicted nuclease of predicted toxin-antitoxin system
MKFKIDENLPIEIAQLLQDSGYDAMTVLDQALGGQQDPTISEICRQEARILVTLDLDFADIRTYPPSQYPGIMVLRVNQQDKQTLISLFQTVIPLLQREQIAQRLWIIEPSQVRIRE